ncbi:MAG: DUF4215 domain-containing protein [Deltaproteobacteria bacterium]|nr:DUF4215 domain-containing protein [Deltaproteobacteria bacterium]
MICRFEVNPKKRANALSLGASLLLVFVVACACSSNDSPVEPEPEESDARDPDHNGTDAATDSSRIDARASEDSKQKTDDYDDSGGGGGCAPDPTLDADAYADADTAFDAAVDTALPTCGNGLVDEGEECDDGQNGDDDDGCRDDCNTSCRNAASDCENTPGDCRRPVCEAVTLGMVCGFEADPADLPDDGNSCTIDSCDGSEPVHTDRDDGYPCENSSGLNGDYCKDGTCIDPVCGDGVRGPLEQCDDGDNLSGDGCSADCVLESCGDGNLDAGEDCDDGANGDADDGCDDTCHFSCARPELDCTDDDASDCEVPVCQTNERGQVCGVTLLAQGDACDNRSGKKGDYCRQNACIDPVCGDEIVGPRQGCDDANADPCDGCLPNCKLREEYCGNGYICHPEECDDGNSNSGDGCSASCKSESEKCPPEMVEIPADAKLGVAEPFCMDIFEASRPDATFDLMGTDTSKAESKPNVIPWHVEYMDKTVFSIYQDACEAAGKYLCSEQQWYAACTGSDRKSYVFGNTFDPEICNSVATFCDDYCLDYGISLDSCNANIDSCGYHCGTASPLSSVKCFRVEPTGQFRDCTNDFGVRDLCGNVWEIVPSTDDPGKRGYEIRGGACNCAYPDDRLKCTYNASWPDLMAGFRCCADVN